MPTPDPFHPRGILFDLDGTLIDSLADIAASANATLEQLGFPVHPQAAYRCFVGDGMATLLRRCLPDSVSFSAEEFNHIVEIYRQEYGNRWHEQTVPYPGISEALEELTETGIALAVLSNKPHEFTTRSVRHFFPDTHFAAIQGQQEGITKKPDPGGALRISELIGVSPGDCALVGDSDVDMLTACRAGMHGVGVVWGFRDELELRRAGAATIVSNVGHLVRALGL
jgi:phosphoglycolate phosphatase